MISSGKIQNDGTAYFDLGLTYETVFNNIEKMKKEYGENVSKSLKDVMTTLKAEGKTAEEAVKWIGDKLKEMK